MEEKNGLGLICSGIDVDSSYRKCVMIIDVSCDTQTEARCATASANVFVNSAFPSDSQAQV